MTAIRRHPLWSGLIALVLGAILIPIDAHRFSANALWALCFALILVGAGLLLYGAARKVMVK